jgi:hypothetical protein
MSDCMFDEEDAPAVAPTNYLVVPQTVPADRLQAYELQFRSDRRRHFTIFTEENPITGAETFLNAAQFQVAMNMSHRLPTLADASNWLAGAKPWEG